MNPKHSTEFDRFDKVVGDLLSVPYSELWRKLEEENRDKPKHKKQRATSPASVPACSHANSNPSRFSALQRKLVAYSARLPFLDRLSPIIAPRQRTPRHRTTPVSRRPRPYPIASKLSKRLRHRLGLDRCPSAPCRAAGSIIVRQQHASPGASQLSGAWACVLLMSNNRSERTHLERF